jgi:hypothetical protein
MSDVFEHPHLITVGRYYEGCNTADVALMKSTFTRDVVHYFVDHDPVRGNDALAGYWARVGPKTRARWSVDHALVHDDEAVIEWSMHWSPVGSDRTEMLRGSEWFRFRDGRIAEIRSYHNNPHLHDARNHELRGFPYAQRGYPVVDDPA